MEPENTLYTPDNGEEEANSETHNSKAQLAEAHDTSAVREPARVKAVQTTETEDAQQILRSESDECKRKLQTCEQNITATEAKFTSLQAENVSAQEQANQANAALQSAQFELSRSKEELASRDGLVREANESVAKAAEAKSEALKQAQAASAALRDHKNTAAADLERVKISAQDQVKQANAALQSAQFELSRSKAELLSRNKRLISRNKQLREAKSEALMQAQAARDALLHHQNTADDYRERVKIREEEQVKLWDAALKSAKSELRVWEAEVSRRDERLKEQIEIATKATEAKLEALKQAQAASDDLERVKSELRKSQVSNAADRERVQSDLRESQISNTRLIEAIKASHGELADVTITE